MAKVTFDMSVSLDGFMAGPNDDLERPLGEGGDRLHQWAYDLASWRERHGLEGGESNQDAEVLDEAFTTTGAFLMGRRMFDIAEGRWGDDPPFHGPVFVDHAQRARDADQGGRNHVHLRHGGHRERARAG